MGQHNIQEINEYLESLRYKSPNTIRVYRTAIDKFCEYLKLENFEDLKNLSVRDATRHQLNLQSKMKPSSVNTNIRPLKAMYNWFVNQEYLDRNPFDRVGAVDEPQHIQAFLTYEEMYKIIDFAKNVEDKLIMLMLLTMGLRRSELTNIRLEDITETHIKITGKGDKQRILAIPQDVKEYLDRWLKIREKKYKETGLPYLFISKGRTQYAGNSIRMKLKRIMERAGFPEERISEIHTHSLRHTFTANLFDRNGDIYIAQQLLGHSSINTTKRYAHLRSHILDNAMLGQASLLGGGENQKEKDNQQAELDFS